MDGLETLCREPWNGWSAILFEEYEQQTQRRAQPIDLPK